MHCTSWSQLLCAGGSGDTRDAPGNLTKKVYQHSRWVEGVLINTKNLFAV